MGKIPLTRTGYEKLLRELEFLSKVERPQVVRELLEAAQEGKVEENPDFKSALAERQKIDRRIQQLQEVLANAEVLVGSNLPPDKVRFNSRVRLLNLDTGQEQQFTLVGSLEADVGQGKLSMSSPLGRALLGRAAGDPIRLKTPAGPRLYQILEIHREEV